MTQTSGPALATSKARKTATAPTGSTRAVTWMPARSTLRRISRRTRVTTWGRSRRLAMLPAIWRPNNSAAVVGSGWRAR